MSRGLSPGRYIVCDQQHKRALVGIRWSAGGALAAVVVGVCMLLAPAGGATGLGSAPLPPPALPAGQPPLPTLTLEPTAGPAGRQVTATGEGYAKCQAPVDNSSQIAGEASLFWDGVDHLATVGLDEGSGFSADFTVPESASPGDHKVVSRCTSAERDATSAGFTVTAAMVAVPDLTGLRADEAARALADVGLVLGHVSGPGDMISSQRPAAGTKVPNGSTVEVTVVGPPPATSPAPPASSAPPEPLVEVPNLGNRTMDEARVVLAGAGLALGENPGGGSTVQEQSPPPGTLVRPGTAVTVTPGPPPVTAEEPPVHPSGSTSWWLPVVLLVLVGAVLGAALLIRSARHARKGPAWVSAHVRAAARAASAVGIDVGPRMDHHSPPTCAVRITTHAGSTTQVLEEVKK